MKKTEDLYTDWKTSRSRVDVPDGFSDRVMAEIGRQERAAVEAGETGGLPPFLENAVEILVGFGLSALGAFRVAHLVGGLLLP